MLKVDDQSLSLHIGLWWRFGLAYFGPAPRAAASDVVAYTLIANAGVDEIASAVRFHWSLFAGTSARLVWVDARGTSVAGGGRAFVRVWPGHDAVAIRIRKGRKWSLFVTSERSAAKQVALLRQYCPQAREVSPQEFLAGRF